jgi:hypothetical protein
MRDEMSILGYGLAREIADLRNGRRRWRCPAELKRRVVGFARERRADGASWDQIAREVGVAGSALKRWVDADGAEEVGALVPVALRRDNAGVPAVTGTLALVSPGGYRLEGLDLVSAARVLRMLG